MNDSLFWPIYSSGEFTVKSIHKSLVSHRINPISPLCPVQWQDLWKLKVHDRLKLLLWKVVWEVMPTKVTVAARVGSNGRRDVDLLCALCGEHSETLHHLLLLCPFSCAVWSESHGSLILRCLERVQWLMGCYSATPSSICWHPIRRPAFIPTSCYYCD